MIIGYLGDIMFRVSSDVVETFKNAQWSGSVQYSKHKRHARNVLTEFTGIDADEFSLDITLASTMGVDVMGELVKIWDYEREGEILPLVIGDKIYGKYRWNISSHKIKMRYYDGAGNLSAADVSVKLLEYMRNS